MIDVPHASKQLHQTSVSKGDTYHQAWRAQTSRTHIDQTQDEGGQGEGGQAEGCRIGDSAILDLLVCTGLKFSSEGWQTLIPASSVDVSERTIAKASGGFGGLVFVVGHVTLGAVVAIALLIEFAPVAGELGIRGGGHCCCQESFDGLGGLEVYIGVGGWSNSFAQDDL